MGLALGSVAAGLDDPGVAKERNSKQREGNEIEFARIAAFSDGVFAIAITLLVLAINIPDELHDESLADALWGQREDLLAYALSFAVIGRFWPSTTASSVKSPPSTAACSSSTSSISPGSS